MARLSERIVNKTEKTQSRPPGRFIPLLLEPSLFSTSQPDLLWGQSNYWLLAKMYCELPNEDTCFVGLATLRPTCPSACAPPVPFPPGVPGAEHARGVRAAPMSVVLLCSQATEVKSK